MALLYAVLDGSDVIRPHHLRAALALVEYARRSAFNVFGGGGPDGRSSKPHDVGESADPPTEDPPHVRLLTLARSRPDGITKTDAHAVFSRNRRVADLDADLVLLTSNGFGSWQGNRWYATEHAHAVSSTSSGSPGTGFTGGVGDTPAETQPEPVRTTKTNAADVDPVNGLSSSSFVSGEPETTEVACGSCRWYPAQGTRPGRVIKYNPACEKLACDQQNPPPTKAGDVWIPPKRTNPPPASPPTPVALGAAEPDDVPPGTLEAALGAVSAERGLL